MEFTRKMVLLPAERVESLSEPKTRAETKLEHVDNLLQIALKLAKVKGYNDFNQILGISGGYIPETDVRELLKYTLTPLEAIKGENEFIELLFKAKVDPKLITNKNIYEKLIALYNKPTFDFLKAPILLPDEQTNETPNKKVKTETNKEEKSSKSEIGIKPKVSKTKAKASNPKDKSKQNSLVNAPRKYNLRDRVVNPKTIKRISNINWDYLSDDE